MATPYKVCPNCQNPAHLSAGECIQCGHHYRTPFVPRADQTQAYNVPSPIDPPISSHFTMARSESSNPFLIAFMWLFVVGVVALWVPLRNAAIAANIGAIITAIILAVSPSPTNRSSGWIMLGLQSLLILLVLGGFLHI